MVSRLDDWRVVRGETCGVFLPWRCGHVELETDGDGWMDRYESRLTGLWRCCFCRDQMKMPWTLESKRASCYWAGLETQRPRPRLSVSSLTLPLSHYSHSPLNSSHRYLPAYLPTFTHPISHRWPPTQPPSVAHRVALLCSADSHVLAS